MQLSSANSGSNGLGKLTLSALRLESLCYLPVSTSQTLAIYLLGYYPTGITVGYLSGLCIIKFADPLYDVGRKECNRDGSIPS
jgi:hypothetical protein